jgi:hypothetical protein
MLSIADFNALPSRKHDEEVQLCAFDVLAVGGKDLRKLPLSMRKMNLEQLLARRPEGVFINPWRVALAPGTTITGGTQEECPFFGNYSTRCTCVGWPGVPALRRDPGPESRPPWQALRLG